MTSPVVVLANAQAGSLTSDAHRTELVDAIRAALPGADVRFCDEKVDVAALAAEVVAQGARLVVAAGGDGTVNSVARAVLGTGATLGLLPLGTLNHFAKDLGIPTDRDEALKVLAAGIVECVDVAEVNERLFLNNSGLGLYPSIVRLRDQRQERGSRKWPAFIWASLKALSRYRSLHVHVKSNGTSLSRATPIVFVGNNRYAMTGRKLGTRERIDEGVLSLVMPHPSGPVRLVWYSILALFGRRFAGKDDVDIRYGPAFRIDSHHDRLRVSIDGELTEMTPPLEYRVRPRALRVVAPPPAEAA